MFTIRSNNTTNKTQNILTNNKTTNIAIAAVFNQDIDKLKLMPDEILTKPDYFGRTAIHAACHKGYTDILIYLIKVRKMNPHTKDYDGISSDFYECGMEWKK